MARMTISIPDELQKRMRRVKSENWSAVAATAFETKLTEIDAIMRREKVLKLLKSRSMNVPKGADMGEVRRMRSELVERITFQADWREEKALEYPSDQRNARSAVCLRQLASQLDNISPNDVLWIRYWSTWNQTEEALKLVEHESEELRSYGFHGNGPAELNDENAVQFLRQLVDELERLLAEEIVDNPARNAGALSSIKRSTQMAEIMFTYITSNINGDDQPSGRYGTINAIRQKFGSKVDIVDAPPVTVQPKDFCPYWPGFAKQGYKPG